MGLPALRVVSKTSQAQQDAAGDIPSCSLSPGDVFDLERMKDLYRKGVAALERVACYGNDNAKAGAAKTLVELFKTQAESDSKKTRRIRVSWMDPLAVRASAPIEPEREEDPLLS